MERAQKVIVVEQAPPAPVRKKSKNRENDVLEKQKRQLEMTPDSLVVDNQYPQATREASLRSVKAAAYQVNVGARRGWPSDTYYAVWRESPDDPNVLQLLIGLRAHMKEDWAPIVNRAGSRKKKSADVVQDADPFETDGDGDADAA